MHSFSYRLLLAYVGVAGLLSACDAAPMMPYASNTRGSRYGPNNLSSDAPTTLPPTAPCNEAMDTYLPANADLPANTQLYARDGIPITVLHPWKPRDRTQCTTMIMMHQRQYFAECYSLKDLYYGIPTYWDDVDPIFSDQSWRCFASRVDPPTEASIHTAGQQATPMVSPNAQPPPSNPWRQTIRRSSEPAMLASDVASLKKHFVKRPVRAWSQSDALPRPTSQLTLGLQRAAMQQPTPPTTPTTHTDVGGRLKRSKAVLDLTQLHKQAMRGQASVHAE